MNNKFYCPKCKSQISFDDNVVFSIRNNKGEKSLLVLSGELGDFSVKNKPEFLLNLEDMLEFYCPVCHESVSSRKSKEMASIIMKDLEDIECEVFFAKTLGKHSTYVIYDDRVDTYGENIEEFMNYFGLKPS